MARRSDHTRPELTALAVDAARAIVAADGPAALTARRVADDIGYTPGTLYNLFSSMDELVLRVNVITLRALYEMLTAIPDARRGVADNLKAMARAYRAFARKHRQHWLLLFLHNPDAGQMPPDWYLEEVGKLFSPLEELLKPLYTPRQSARRKLAARALWASVHGMVFLEETGRIPVIAAAQGGDDMAALLIDNFVRGAKGAK
jgi:AcrR family transcriptional regulator